MPSVSVVVPIHNAVDYLSACVDSLLAQTVEAIEVILVDDGSSDGSGLLADRFGRDHANVRVLHQQHSSLSAARNVGMRVCTGDYLSVIDPCDWVAPTMYEQLLKTAVEDGADIVSSGHRDVCGSVTRSVRPHPLAGIVLRKRRDILGMRKQLFGSLPGDSMAQPLALFVGASIYRRAFVEEHSLAFEDVLAEDTLFSIAAYAHARCISFACTTDYRYRVDDAAWRVRMRSRDGVSLDRYERLIDRLATLAGEEPDAADYLKRTRHTAVTYAILYVREIESGDLSGVRQTSAIRRLVESRMFQEYCIGLPRRGMPMGERLIEHELEHDNVWVVLGLTRLQRMLRTRGNW